VVEAPRVRYVAQQGTSLVPESSPAEVGLAGRPEGAVTATTLGTGPEAGYWAPLGVLHAETEVIR